MKTLNRNLDLRVYNMLCHFAHGSVWAMQTLKGNIRDPEASLVSALRSCYCRYLESTRKFVSFIWQPLITPEGEDCKNDIIRITVDHVRDAE